jgi:hypothetical protein
MFARLCLLLVPGIFVAALGGAEARKAVPSTAAVAQATQELRRTFKADYANRQQSGAFAARMEQSVATTTGDPDRYVLLREGIDLAIKGGEAGIAFRLLDLLIAGYETAPVAERQALLTALSRHCSPFESAVLAQQALRAAQLAVDIDDYDAASQAVAVALAQNGRHRDETLTARARELDADLRVMAKEFKALPVVADALIGAQPTPEDNLASGRFQCLIKGDWRRGLPLLRRSGEGILHDLAVKEAETGKGAAAERVALADAWWDYAGKQSGRMRACAQEHALVHYRAEVAALTGVTKARVAQRIDEQPPAEAAHPPGSVNLWPMLTLEKGSFQGQWRNEKGVLLVEKNDAGDHLTIPVVPRGDYRLDAEFEVMEGGGEAMFLLAVHDVSLNSFVYGEGTSIHRIDERMLENTGVRLAVGKRQAFSATVRQSGSEVEIATTIDGRPGITWRGPQETVFSAHRRAPPTRPGALGLGAWHAKVAFHSARLTMLAGRVIPIAEYVKSKE